MVREVCLALLASVDLVGVEVDVVRQAHVSGRADRNVLSEILKVKSEG